MLADPLGGGENLFGTANAGWAPDAAGFSALLQIAILLIGLYWSANVAQRLAKTTNKPAFRQVLPTLVFILLFSLAMLWLLIG